MIKQSAIGLNSRSEANPYDENGFLPLITAPMYSVVDETNYQVFLDNKIKVCLPRNTKLNTKTCLNNNMWMSYSLNDFQTLFTRPNNLMFKNLEKNVYRICIDTANGNIPALHEAIRKAKEIHGDNLVIMAGNVANVEAFASLAKTGADYIRVGIGGGGACHSSSNTGVGQKNLEKLITKCWYLRNRLSIQSKRHEKNWQEKLEGKRVIDESEESYFSRDFYIKEKNTGKVKIVADGISTHIKRCESKYGFNDNGYAAINKLLFAGADLVMVGKLFAQCLESAGEKGYKKGSLNEFIPLSRGKSPFAEEPLYVKYSGMSTQQEQKKYKPLEDNLVFDYRAISIGEWYNDKKQDIKPSEGSVQWIPVCWTINEWLNGSDDQDSYPYLMGWINSIKSAMAYTNRKTLK